MTILRAARSAVAVALLLGVAACADRGGTTGPDVPASPSGAAATDGLVLRVEYTGGFAPPSVLRPRLPIVSVYADGRMISEGPVAAIHPGPALPNLQVRQIAPDGVQDLVDRALTAGVAETSDLGTPPVADAFSTRFTVVTTAETYVREVYALWEAPEDQGLTAEQEAARDELSEFLETLTDHGGDTVPYEPEAVAVIAFPWIDPQDGLSHPEQPWPGPALPGEATGAPHDVGCVTAAGAEAQALLEAARGADAATPWVTGDGMRWSVTFRPLLPDETGCPDLVD
jgi:hypothetical protein